VLLEAVIFNNSVPIYICLSTDYCHSKVPGKHLTIVYGQTAGVHNIFSSALCGCH